MGNGDIVPLWKRATEILPPFGKGGLRGIFAVFYD
jgi:hypothetical protein